MKWTKGNPIIKDWSSNNFFFQKFSFKNYKETSVVFTLNCETSLPFQNFIFLLKNTNLQFWKGGGNKNGFWNCCLWSCDLYRPLKWNCLKRDWLKFDFYCISQSWSILRRKNRVCLFLVLPLKRLRFETMLEWTLSDFKLEKLNSLQKKNNLNFLFSRPMHNTSLRKTKEK